ncbi:MAG: hypothetical protein DMG22_20880 [Acidobacteria bacterium]|nr:MAG: hypothetical protein DMG22_20880 [Acidobacteriota bacterium]
MLESDGLHRSLEIGPHRRQIQSDPKALLRQAGANQRPYLFRRKNSAAFIFGGYTPPLEFQSTENQPPRARPRRGTTVAETCYTGASVNRGESA